MIDSWMDCRKRTVVGRIVVGATYLTHFTGLRYRVVGLCQDLPSWQVKILHVGLEGKDEGKLFTCSETNFAINFRLVEPAIPRVGVEPAPIYDLHREVVNVAAKIADQSDRSSGV